HVLTNAPRPSPHGAHRPAGGPPPLHARHRRTANRQRVERPLNDGRGIVGSVALTLVGCRGTLRRHTARPGTWSSGGAWFGVRRVSVPARGGRVGGALVSAVRPVLPRRGGTAGRTRYRRRPRYDPPLGAALQPATG